MSDSPLRRLHLGLTRERDLVGTPYLDDPELLAAYRDHFAPMSYRKAAAVLREVCDPARPPRRIVDLGAGPGPMAAAAHDLFPQAEVCAADRSARALDLVPKGIARAVWDLASDTPPPAACLRADVLLFGNVLNELPGVPAARLERIATQLLADDGLVIVIEPALRETARALEQARDRLIRAGWFVVAPCLYAGDCPALVRERDWCHEDRSLRAEDETLKFAYLVLKRRGLFPTDERRFRIVSAKRKEKGRERMFGCGPAGRFPLVRLKRHRDESNSAFDTLARGDIVEIDGLERKGEELRIGGTTRVRVITPVQR